MNTRQIDFCIELAHTLNFSRAAENMYASQPTFSYQIKMLEDEVGFQIFDRSSKGVSLTPAGSQFVSHLVSMKDELKRAIEQGQNYSRKYKDSISVCLSVRQSLYFLPEAIRQFAQISPEIQILPSFRYENSVEHFLQNKADILFALKDQTRHIPAIQVHALFKSRIYLIVNHDDILAKKNMIQEKDLYGRTLMVGGGSPDALRRVQHRLINSGKIEYFNSFDHDTTLTNIAARKGICLSPGFLNDHSGQFAWIPFDCEEHFSCVLCTHKEDQRESLKTFIQLLKKLYQDAVAFPL